MTFLTEATISVKPDIFLHDKQRQFLTYVINVAYFVRVLNNFTAKVSYSQSKPNLLFICYSLG